MQPLNGAFGFTVGQPVRMLVATSGDGDNYEPVSLAPGAIAIIDDISNYGGHQRTAFTLSIEGKIVNSFDEADGLPRIQFFEPIAKNGDEETLLSNTDIMDIDTYLSAASAHADAAVDPDHEIGDLQDMFHCLWPMLKPNQKRAFFSEPVQAILASGGIISDT